MRQAGMENELEKMNRNALKLARQVADKTGTLMAGDICTTTVYDPDNVDSHATAKAMFKVWLIYYHEKSLSFVILLS